MFLFPEFYSPNLVDHHVKSLITTADIGSMRKLIISDLNQCRENKSNYCLCSLLRSEEMLWLSCHPLPQVSISGIHFTNYSLFVLLWICWQNTDWVSAN